MLLRTAIRPAPSFFSRAQRPLLVAFGLSLPFLQPRPVTYCDVSPAADFSSSGYSHSKDAKTPLAREGRLNPAAIKQISLGSILGLGAGVLLSAFSRSLTLLVGLGIVVWQVCAREEEEGRIETNVGVVCGEERLQHHTRGPGPGVCQEREFTKCNQRQCSVQDQFRADVRASCVRGALGR